MESPTSQAAITRKRLGELLIEAGIIRPDELPVGLEASKERSLRLGEVLIMMRYVSAEDLEAALEAQTKLQEGAINELDAVEALRTASSYRISFDKALRRIRSTGSAKERDDAENAIKAGLEELAQKESTLGIEHRDLIPVFHKIGDAWMKLGQPAPAEKLYKRAAQLSEKCFNNNHPKVAESLTKLALAYSGQEKLSEAETLLWRALEIAQNTWGGEHAEVANVQKHVAQLMARQGRHKEAEQFYLSSLKIAEKVLGPDHPEVTDGLRHLANFWNRQGKSPDKKRLGEFLVEIGMITGNQLQQALQYAQKNTIPIGQALVKLNMVSDELLRPVLQAQLLVGDGVMPLQLAGHALRAVRNGEQFDEALRQLGWDADRFTTQELKLLLNISDELVTAETALGSDHAGVAVLSLKLGDAYVAQKRFSEAEYLYKRAINILERFFGPKDSEVATGLFKLAQLYLSQTRMHEAEPLLWKTLEIRQQALGPNHLAVCEVLDQLASLQLKTNMAIQAEPLIMSSLSIKESTLGKSHRRVLESLSMLIEAYTLNDKNSEAETAFRRLINLTQKNGTPIELAAVLEKLADFYAANSDLSNASTQYELALEIRQEEKDESLEAIVLLEKYALLLKRSGRMDEHKEYADRAKQLRKSQP